MTDDIEELKRNYREIKAPQHIATRIRAEVGDRKRGVPRWIPLTASVMVAVTAVWFLPVVLQQQAAQVTPTTTPSLSALARLKPAKPTVSAPSLSKVRSVRVPAVPVRPNVRPPARPRSQIEFKLEDAEENNHAYI